MSTTDCMNFLDEIITVLSNKDDDEFRGMQEAGVIQAKLLMLRHNREEEIKKAVEALTSDYETELVNVQEEHSKARDTELEEQHIKEKEILAHKEEVEHQVKKLRTDKETLDKENERLVTERENIEDKTTRKVPVVRHDVNLYNYLFGIRWQFDREAHEIEGYVTRKSSVKTFSLNSKQNSQYFITNYLWDQMEPDW